MWHCAHMTKRHGVRETMQRRKQCVYSVFIAPSPQLVSLFFWLLLWVHREYHLERVIAMMVAVKPVCHWQRESERAVAVISLHWVLPTVSASGRIFCVHGSPVSRHCYWKRVREVYMIETGGFGGIHSCCCLFLWCSSYSSGNSVYVQYPATVHLHSSSLFQWVQSVYISWTICSSLKLFTIEEQLHATTLVTRVWARTKSKWHLLFETRAHTYTISSCQCDRDCLFLDTRSTFISLVHTSVRSKCFRETICPLSVVTWNHLIYLLCLKSFILLLWAVKRRRLSTRYYVSESSDCKLKQRKHCQWSDESTNREADSCIKCYDCLHWTVHLKETFVHRCLINLFFCTCIAINEKYSRQQRQLISHSKYL